MECADPSNEFVDEGGCVIVVYKDKAGVDKMTPVPYNDEDELQSVLEEYPGLLQDVDEPSLRLIGRKVYLDEAGEADLLFLDEDGHLTVVEVKLARNGESRREVLAQVFDYTSALAEYTIDELDDKVKGKLDMRLRELAGVDESSGTQYDRLWKSCADSMRAGSVRVVVAMDDNREDLARIVRFVNDHSDLDVRLLIVRKYTSDEKTVLVPEFIVRGGGTEVSIRAGARSSMPGTIWDEEKFFASIKEIDDTKVIDAVRDLYEFTKSKSTASPWRMPSPRPKFNFYFKKDGKDYVLFWVLRYESGMSMHLYGLQSWGWGKGLKSIGLDLSDTAKEREFSLDDLVKEVGLEKFKKVVEDVVAGGSGEN